MINHRYMKWVVAIGAGFLLALWAFDRSTDPEPTRQKVIQEAVVAESRLVLKSYVAPDGQLHLVDPLAPDHKIGKVYILPAGNGWDVSGHYRRNEADQWHPYLLKLDSESRLISLAVKDGNSRLIDMSSRDERFSAVP
jgi:hypothetical protein